MYRIPARFGTKVPSRASLVSYLATEQAGLIWVCMADEPTFQVPEFPQFDDPTYRIVTVDAYDWDCALPRRIENYVDFAHLAWVHDGVLGDRQHPQVPDHGIGRVGGELQFDHPFMTELADSDKIKALETAGGPVAVEVDYRLFIPNTVLLDQWMPELKQRYLLFFSVCPTGPKTCRSFTFMGRDYSFDEQTDHQMLEFNELVIGQDLPLVQSQRPEELPMDLSAEVQIRGADRVAVEYRRWLREIAYADA